MPDKTFLVVALDLLSGLTQGLQDDSNALYQTQEAQVFTLLILCLQVSLLVDHTILVIISLHSTPILLFDNRRTLYWEIARSPSSPYSSDICLRSCLT